MGVPGLVKSAVHVPGESEPLSTSIPTCQPLPQVIHMYGGDDCIPQSHADVERGGEEGNGSSEITSGTRNPHKMFCPAFCLALGHHGRNNLLTVNSSLWQSFGI